MDDLRRIVVHDLPFLHDDDLNPDMERLTNLADRIASFLPPREDP